MEVAQVGRGPRARILAMDKEVAVRSREDIFLQLMSTMNGTSTSVLLVLLFIAKNIGTAETDFGQTDFAILIFRLWPNPTLPNRLWPEKFDRLWPTLIDRLWPNRLWPTLIGRLWPNLPRRGGGASKGGAPKGGGPKPRKSEAPEGWGPEGWGPRRVGPPKGGAPEGLGARKGGAPKGWGPEGWGAQNFALFLPFPATVSFSLCLSGGLLVEFWWCF